MIETCLYEAFIWRLPEENLKILLFYIESVTITPKDSRWVGAWWMGFLVSSGLLLISSIPFWFLPRSMPKQESEENRKTPVCEILSKTEDAQNNNQNFKLTEIAKGRVVVCLHVQVDGSYVIFVDVPAQVSFHHWGVC